MSGGPSLAERSMWWFGVTSLLAWFAFVVMVFSGWSNWDHKVGCALLGVLSLMGWFVARLADGDAALKAPSAPAPSRFRAPSPPGTQDSGQDQ